MHLSIFFSHEQLLLCSIFHFVDDLKNRLIIKFRNQMRICYCCWNRLVLFQHYFGYSDKKGIEMSIAQWPLKATV